MSIETLITLFILVIIAIAIIWIVSVWVYKRAPANRGFIRTGLGGTKVCLGKGALVLPVFHEVTRVSLETIKLIVSRSRDHSAVINIAWLPGRTSVPSNTFQSYPTAQREREGQAGGGASRWGGGVGVRSVPRPIERAGALF